MGRLVWCLIKLLEFIGTTLLVVHQVPLIFMMALLGQLSQQARDLDRRVLDLEATVQFLRNRLGL